MALASNATFTLDITENVARLTLNRPPLNILTLEMTRELNDVLTELAESYWLKALVLDAAGKAFCAGVDVADHLPERAEAMIRAFAEVCRRLRALPLPTIAVVQGAALGGGTELAVSCDIVLSGQSARFGQPEIKLGVFPPVAAALFPALIGYQQAARLLFTGESIGAEEAARLGLVTFVVPDSELDEARERLLAQLRGLSATALSMTKRALLLGMHYGEKRALPVIENLYIHELMTTDDAREGIQSFMEKRPPAWRNTVRRPSTDGRLKGVAPGDSQTHYPDSDYREGGKQ
ncbi:MAG TPA: enoyl-CoA hydratase-related protein [Ktedonobacteraceae bacterium]|nr:enoyl-CoA hydratase-related protein [Ktedonobacteraceae bacterium]